MTTDAERIHGPAAGDGARVRIGLAAAALPLFAGTIALSAFLLFSVEPLVGRLTLPTFGGTPAVWATVLFFFQSVLLVGYAYGHLSATRLGPRRGAVVHVVLAMLALAAIAVAPTRIGDLRDVGLPAVVNLVWILIVTIGAPALLLTSTTPLLSSWFAAIRSGDDAPADPYWLYALSNAGSFAALLAYPFLIESSLGLAAQRTAWAIGVIVLVACLTACAALVRRRVRTADPGQSSTTPPELALTGAAVTGTAVETPVETIDWARRGRWLLLAAVPSGLLSAVTNFITTDLISAPLLWVVPLSIYLLTFVIAFSERGRRIVPGAEWLAPAAVTLLWVPFGSAAGWPIVPLLLVEFFGLAIVATTLHGRLAADRPSPAHLTEFYLVISAGGVLASSLVAVVAPTLFKDVWEYPLLLVLALGAMAVARPVRAARASAAVSAPPRAPRHFDLSPFLAGAPARLAPYVIAAVLLGLALFASDSIGFKAGVRWMLVGGLILLVGGQPRFLFASTALVLALAVFVLPPPAVFQDRSFFGVTTVLRPDRPVTILLNGTTVHGSQSTDPAYRRIPGSYYVAKGPLGDIFEIVRARPGADAGRAIGVVGLGSGTVAAWARTGDALTFYEIDPLVIRVASDPAYFTWLSDAAVPARIVLGDARLSLATEPKATYDLLVLDAFSSDAIPAHLLTTEAIADNARVLRPGGVLAIHVSNRYYDLGPAVASAAQAAGLTVLERVYEPTEADKVLNATHSRWLIATTDPADVPGLVAAGWYPVRAGVQPLTDDHPDLLRLLRIGLW